MGGVGAKGDCLRKVSGGWQISSRGITQTVPVGNCSEAPETQEEVFKSVQSNWENNSRGCNKRRLR